ncbi:hypothetical protein TDB9533_04622 [Thalassocella blandensis]|nr:hypothetical protein TDB9533_04622 [Thalassocella blandensis]
MHIDEQKLTSLQTRLEIFCQKIFMQCPPIDDNGCFILQFDAKLSVSFQLDKNQIVLLSPIPTAHEYIDHTNLPGTLNNRSEINWEIVKKWMQKSFAWTGLSISLVLDNSDEINVQSIIPEDITDDRFFELTDSHCNFCESLLNETVKQPLAPLNYHAFITP